MAQTPYAKTWPFTRGWNILTYNTTTSGNVSMRTMCPLPTFLVTKTRRMPWPSHSNTLTLSSYMADLAFICQTVIDLRGHVGNSMGKSIICGVRIVPPQSLNLLLRGRLRLTTGTVSNTWLIAIQVSTWWLPFTRLIWERRLLDYHLPLS